MIRVTGPNAPLVVHEWHVHRELRTGDERRQRVKLRCAPNCFAAIDRCSPHMKLRMRPEHVVVSSQGPGRWRSGKPKATMAAADMQIAAARVNAPNTRKFFCLGNAVRGRWSDPDYHPWPKDAKGFCLERAILEPNVQWLSLLNRKQLEGIGDGAIHKIGDLGRRIRNCRCRTRHFWATSATSLARWRRVPTKKGPGANSGAGKPREVRTPA
jgi:uncharacterized protein YjhX (UPF0386 family)